PISRASIAKKLTITKRTVSSLASELLEEEIIIEYGPGTSRGGGRPRMLLFNEKAGFSIGIDLGVNYILATLTNLNGEVIYEKKQTITELNKEVILTDVIKIIKETICSAPQSPYGMIGIG
ncbi:hypothetical protein KWI09_23945, partial [Enterobacter cloacae]|nr:hypothetical protein [Enterobacter cloacae]